MAFTSHTFFLSRSLTKAVVPLALIVAGLLLHVCFHTESFVDNRSINEPLPSAVWPEARSALVFPFSAFSGKVDSDRQSGQAAFLSDFRFVGTFFLYGSEGDGTELRRGVLSYLPDSKQEIVSEGSIVGGATVKSIFEDCIVLVKNREEGTLWLGGTDSSVVKSYFAEKVKADESRMRFGEQVGNGVWTLEKSALLDYYDELLDNPERLLQVFDSMKPLYSPEDGGIEGYVLQPVGEREFFDAVGFEEGDVVRKVNSLPMTNRNRAEFFIKQVVESRLSAVVIDVERGGSSKRLVYQLR